MKKNLLLLTMALCLNTSLFAQQTITIQPGASEGKDAFIFDYYPTDNYGSDDRLDITAWTQSGTPYVSRALIQFDLNSIPQTAFVNSAYLSLYHNNTTVFYNGVHSGTNASFLRKVVSAWDENTVNWVNQPGFTTANQVFTPQTTSGTQDYNNLDVTVLVADMVSNPSTNYGFMLMLQNEIEYRDLIFASSDHANWNLHPKLEITYTVSTDVGESSYNAGGFTIQPNPMASSCLVKSTDEGNLINSAVIYNLAGEKSAVFKTSRNSEIEIQRQGLSAGIYIVELNSETAVLKRLKLVIAD